MKKPRYSILTNFFINDEETLQRMKDSLDSFKSAEAKKWVINIRGKLKDEAEKYIHNSLSEKCEVFNYDLGDWQKETKILINKIDTDYILYWVEDHILQVNSNILDDAVNEMKSSESDFLSYTFHCFGYHKEVYDNLFFNKLNLQKHINTFKLDISSYYKIYRSRKITPNINQYVTALPSIFSKELFINLINRRYYKFKLIETPHFMEKPPYSIRYLPFNFSYTNKELFASIDDDRGIKNYSLINRNKYPKRIGVKFDSSIINKQRGKSDRLFLPEKLRALILIFKHILY